MASMMIVELDRDITGAADVYQRAMGWGHLPSTMTFEEYLIVLRRGDDPYWACSAVDVIPRSLLNSWDEAELEPLELCTDDDEGFLQVRDVA